MLSISGSFAVHFFCDFHEGWSFILISLFHWVGIKTISEETSEYLT